MGNEILQGDALTILKTLPSESVDCVVTSPPYWALRDYGVEGQLGLEPTFQEYIIKLCDIFDEVKRILKKEGTCWVNVGDTYSGNKEGKTDEKVCDYLKEQSNGIHKKATITEKCLCQIPSRFAIEMTNRGWILRNRIIWHKPNCMPSSAKDRFTVDYEDLFFFVKSKKYYFETQIEDAITDGYKPFNKRVRDVKNGRIASAQYRASEKEIENYESTQKYANHTGQSESHHGVGYTNGSMRNKRCVWTIPTHPFPEAHFATYPEALIETPIKAGCPQLFVRNVERRESLFLNLLQTIKEFWIK